MNVPTEDITNYKLGIFYFNKQDPRTLVPKRKSMLSKGWQLNYARPWSAALVAAVLVVTAIWIVRIFKSSFH